MAWTGTPVVRRVGKCTVRITGISLDATTTGTIGAAGTGANIELPADFPGTIPARPAGLVISDLVELDLLRPYGAGGAVATHLHTDIGQTVGGKLLVTFRNDTASTSGALDIRIVYNHSATR